MDRRLPKTLFALVVVAALLVPATRADAQTFPSQVNRTSTLYLCTSSWYVCTTKVATTATSTNRADVICWEEGRTAYSQQKWYYAELDFGGEGYIPAPAVNAAGEDTSAPWCGKVFRIQAARMALDRTDQTLIGTADQTKLTSLGFGPSVTQGNWSGDCIGFATLAWYLGGYDGVPKTGNAIDVYNTYASWHWDQHSPRVPRGALVFWTAPAPWGHVAVSLGNGAMVSTQGLDTSNVGPIVIKSIPSGSVGWVMPLWN